MEVPPVIRYNHTKPRNKGRIFVSVALAIIFVSSLFIVYLLRVLYVGASQLPPGTMIRPMNHAFYSGLVGIASILLGGFCALVGGIISAASRQWKTALCAAVAISICWVPLILAFRGFHYIVGLHNLVLAP
jgi:hypothetical protein